MVSNSSFQILKKCCTKIHNYISLNIKEIVKPFLKFGKKIMQHLRVFSDRFLSPSVLKLITLLRKCNDQLNIYTELKRNYNIQNNQEETRIYLHVVYNGFQKSNSKFLIISEQYNNQQNFFNC